MFVRDLFYDCNSVDHTKSMSHISYVIALDVCLNHFFTIPAIETSLTHQVLVCKTTTECHIKRMFSLQTTSLAAIKIRSRNGYNDYRYLLPKSFLAIVNCSYA